MIAKDYVSFQTAKLLKEKGFDWSESPFYSGQDRDEWRQNNSYTVPNEEYNPELPFDSETLTQVAPHVSLQMAMKWLREVHNIQIELMIAHAMKKRWSYGINKDFNPCTQKIEVFCSYEEACEAAIKYCLENLI